MKQLKGKARKDFIKWYRKKHGKMLHLYFKELSLSEQYGVIQDFFDSVEIDLMISLDIGSYICEVEDLINKERTFTVFCKTRKKARKEIIKLATEQYNKSND